MDFEIHAQDQYAVAPADATLAGLAAALPAGLAVRAPLLDLSVGDWVRAGGVGLLAAPPARQDVLGLSYRARDGGLVEAGGRVVKNVSGYDLVRLVVGSDPALERALPLETVTLRLRPLPRVARREAPVAEAALPAAFEALRALGAAYALAFDAGGWRLRAEWWGDTPAWGEPADAPVPAGVPLRDALGAFPRPRPARTPLEARVLEAMR